MLSSLTLVLPAHNESDNLRWLIPYAAAILPRLAQRCDVVLVDDGSSDGGAELACRLAREAGLQLTVVRHARKSGYGISVGDGLRAARGDFVAFTDADGQFDLADLSHLVPLLAGADLVAGWRARREDAWMRSVVSGIFNALVVLLYGLRVRDVDCAFKLMRREVLDSISLTARSALLNTELFYRARAHGWRIAQTPVPHHPRVAGVRSGARPRAIARAVTELLRLRLRLWRSGA
ncbi:MAG: glycosyltransferase family 2 protein [Candidatus Dormibacteria bacterium]